MSGSLDPVARAKHALRLLLSEQIMGVIDYIRSRGRDADWGPFNGQTARQALFVEIIANIRPHAIVETGTFLGDTTELMSQTGLPVFTFELNPRSYGYVRHDFGAPGMSSCSMETVGHACLPFSAGFCIHCPASRFSFTLMRTGMMICHLRRKLISSLADARWLSS